MTLPEARNFHVAMAACVLGSLILDRLAPTLVPAWRPPAVGLLTFALGLVWVGGFAVHRLRRLEVLVRMLQERVADLDRPPQDPLLPRQRR